MLERKITMSKVNEYFNSEEYEDNSIEIDVKVNDKALEDSIDKLNTMNDLMSKVSINKIENFYVTINHWNKEP